MRRADLLPNLVACVVCWLPVPVWLKAAAWAWVCVDMSRHWDATTRELSTVGSAAVGAWMGLVSVVTVVLLTE